MVHDALLQVMRIRTVLCHPRIAVPVQYIQRCRAIRYVMRWTVLHIFRSWNNTVAVCVLRPSLFDVGLPSLPAINVVVRGFTNMIGVLQVLFANCANTAPDGLHDGMGRCVLVD